MTCLLTLLYIHTQIHQSVFSAEPTQPDWPGITDVQKTVKI